MELLTEAFASAWKRSVNIDSDKLSVWPRRLVVCVCFQPLLHTLLRFSTTVPRTLPRTVPRTDSSRTVLFMFLSAKWSSALWIFQIVNITMAALQYREQQSGRRPVDITFTVRGSRGYLTGSDVSNALMRLTVVEFSYYMGFPVLQIAEREDNRKKLRLNECLILAPVTIHRSNIMVLVGLFPTAFHYPELNTSQVLRSSWLRTGMTSSVVRAMKTAAI